MTALTDLHSTDAVGSVPSPHPGAARSSRPPTAWNLPGLTGLRGIAVVAVIAYHLGYLPGGFVGVDLFFVLSGFLITSLLLRHPPQGPSGLTAWWARRVRRLTPAVAVVVLAVLVLFLTRSGIAMDAFATMTWWQNWHLIAEGTSYWASSPSPLRHAWSLSIEEQFYLLWPMLLVGLVALSRLLHRRFRHRLLRPPIVVAIAAAIGAVVSFAWAAWLASGTDADLSRIYFGTDTRAGALLAGCAMAAWMQRRAERRIRVRRVRPWTTRTAVLAAIALCVLCVTLTPDASWTYRGGLAIAAAAALVLVAACTGPGPIGTALSWDPLQWLGTRSYAIYLWSWPTQLLLQEHWPDLPLALVAAATVAVSLVLADVSMRFVENPLRFRSGWAQAVRPRRAAWGLGVVILAVIGLLAANSTVETQAEKVAKEFEKVPDPTTTTATSLGPAKGNAPVVAPTTTICVPTTVAAPQFSGGTVFDPSTVGDVADPTGSGCGATRVLVVGDSTGRGAANGLRRNASDTLEVWDRTVLGCGIQATKPNCPSWRDIWPKAVAEIRPQVVLVHMGISTDLVPGPEPRFLSAEASQLRQQVIGEAMDALRAGGARVVWALPAVPLDQGTFYCGGARRGTGCDPAWILKWDSDVIAAAAPRGVTVVDLDSWVASRGRTLADRGDGLHFSGEGLDAEAAWLAPQLR